MCMQNCSKKYMNWGLLTLRFAVGAVFIYHGWMKLNGMEGTVGMMTSIGLPVPMFWAWLVALVEFVGGIAIVLGLFNRIVTAVLAIDMMVALFAVHTKMPYKAAELPVLLLGTVVALHTTGAGKYALMGRKTEVYECGGQKCRVEEKDRGCCGGGCCESEEKDGKTKM